MPIDPKTLDKIRKLINLASSNNLQEAQQAAWRACALIREHGIDVVDPDTIDAVYQELSTAQAQLREKPSGSAFDPAALGAQLGADFATALDAAALGDWATISLKTPRGSRHTTQYHARPPKSQQPPPVQPMTAPIRLQQRFRTPCRYCGAVQAQGAEILWQKDVGTWCATTSCYQDWLANGKQPKGAKVVPDFNPWSWEP